MAPARPRVPWLVAAGVISLVLTVQPFRDTDVWWHLALGRQILNHGIPAQEPFSFLHAANPWVGQQWLYEVTLARVVDLGGAGLASLAMGGLASAALVIAVLSIPPERRPSGPWSAAAVLAGALVAAQLVGVRGQVITLFGLATVLYVLMRWRRGSSRWLLLLPPLFVLWANLHAGFIVGLLVGTAALLLARAVPGRSRAELAAVLAVAAAATLLNPAGPALWGYVAATFANPTLTGVVAEWQSPDFHNVWLRIFEGAALLLVLAWFLAPRRDAFDMVVAGAALLASLQAQRNVALFAVIATPQLARYGAEAWAALRPRLARRVSALRGHPSGRRPPGSRPPRWFPAVAGAVVVAATAVALTPRLTAAAATDFERTHLPMAPAGYVAAHLAGQRIYSPDTWGGYLAERFPSGRVVYLYDETAVFGDAALQQYLEIHQVRAGWPAVFARDHITVAVLPVAAPEVSALLSVGWRVDCRDDASASVVMSATASSGSASAAEVTAAGGCH